MPTDTFLNLPNEKKNRLIKAAKEQFSKSSFEEVSINQIIKSASISRGSFYNYFKDKTDLLYYILNHYIQQVKSDLEDQLQQGKGDLFSFYEYMFLYFLTKISSEEDADFIKNIFSQWRIIMSTSKVTSHILKTNTDYTKELINKMNWDALNISTEEDKHDIIEILSLITRQCIVKSLQKKYNENEAKTNFYNKMRLIRQGFVSKQGVMNQND